MIWAYVYVLIGAAFGIAVWRDIKKHHPNREWRPLVDTAGFLYVMLGWLPIFIAVLWHGNRERRRMDKRLHDIDAYVGTRNSPPSEQEDKS